MLVIRFDLVFSRYITGATDASKDLDPKDPFKNLDRPLTIPTKLFWHITEMYGIFTSINRD